MLYNHKPGNNKKALRHIVRRALHEYWYRRVELKEIRRHISVFKKSDRTGLPLVNRLRIPVKLKVMKTLTLCTFRPLLHMSRQTLNTRRTQKLPKSCPKLAQVI